MPFERPTIAKLTRRIKGDIQTRLTGADTNLRGSPEEVLAIGSAGLAHGLHGHLKWLSKQLLEDLMDDEFLIRRAGVYGLTQTPAVAASFNITITGTNTTVCPSGTTWQRSDGAEFTTDADATISGGEATVSVTAAVAGDDGNTDAGTSLTISGPVAGVNSTATVLSTGVITGVDTETTEALRSRLLLRLQNPPKGGGTGDYVNWALEVSGVTRAWEAPLMNGPGTVGLRFVRDNDVSIIPDAGEIATVQAYIDALRPITADVEVLAPVAVTLNFTIEPTPDNSTIRAAIDAELRAFLLRVAEPGATIYLSQINEAISIAAGETNHVTTVPAADVTHTAGQIAVFGAITWV